MFLSRVEAAVSVMQVETSVKKILNKFFKEYNLPMPRIKIANSLTAKWLGRDVYKSGDTNTQLEVQKRITDDEKTLDRILTHELIHHWEFLILNPNADAKNSYIQKANKIYQGKQTSHGKPFRDWSAKINSVMGKDYVTEVSDSTYVLTSLDKDYYVLITPFPNINRLGWAWAVRPSSTQWQIIKYNIENRNSKLFKTRDDRFLRGTKIKRGSLSLPHTGTEDGKILQGFLQEMYKSGKEVTI
jgi:hypothetical protein